MKMKLITALAAFCLVIGISTVAMASEYANGELTCGESVAAVSAEAGSDYIFDLTPESDGVYEVTLTLDDEYAVRLYAGEYESDYSSTIYYDDDNTVSLTFTVSAGEEYQVWVNFEEDDEVEFTLLVDEYPTSGTCGDNVTWSYADGVLTISGTGDMDDYGYTYYDEYDECYYYDTISAPFDAYSELITSVVVEDGVTSIGMSAFEWYSNITSVTLADSVVTVDDYAFYGATSLTDINLENVTYVGDGAFMFTSLTDIDIENVTYIGGSAFQGTSLTSIELSDELTYIGGFAFAATDITEITIPASVTTIEEGVFGYCENLETITVEDGNTACTVVDGVLYNADMTTILCYPAGKTDTEFTIPDGVTRIGEMAFAYGSFSTLNFADSVTEIGEDAFYRCVFTEIIIGKNVEVISAWAFESCYYLETVYIPLSVTEVEMFAFYTWSSNEITYYYQGSEEDWAEVDNNEIDEEDIVFNCEDVWGSTIYDIIEAETSESYTLGSGAITVIAVDADIDYFVSVAVEGTILTQDTDYTVSEGSTLITFAESYLESLSVGTYDVVITFTNGTAYAELVILESAADSTDSTDSSTTETTAADDTESTESTESVTSVDTGDSSQAFVWIMVSLCAAAAVVITGRKKYFI